MGLAHRYSTPMTAAIDIDYYPLALDWLGTRGVDLQELLKEPDSLVIHSGKKFSLKLLYSLPSFSYPMPSLRVVSDDGATCMLELRCAAANGLTVQDIIPPSVHPSGNPYVWVKGSPLAMPILPNQILDIWLKELETQKSQHDFGDGQVGGCRNVVAVPESPRRIAQVADALAHIDADCSHDTWFRVVWGILSTGWSVAEDIALNWSRSAPQRYEELGFLLKIRSYNPNHSNPISLGTVYYFARLGGWNG